MGRVKQEMFDDEGRDEVDIPDTDGDERQNTSIEYRLGRLEQLERQHREFFPKDWFDKGNEHGF